MNSGDLMLTQMSPTRPRPQNDKTPDETAPKTCRDLIKRHNGLREKESNITRPKVPTLTFQWEAQRSSTSPKQPSVQHISSPVQPVIPDTEQLEQRLNLQSTDVEVADPSLMKNFSGFDWPPLLGIPLQKSQTRELNQKTEGISAVSGCRKPQSPSKRQIRAKACLEKAKIHVVTDIPSTLGAGIVQPQPWIQNTSTKGFPIGSPEPGEPSPYPRSRNQFHSNNISSGSSTAKFQERCQLQLQSRILDVALPSPSNTLYSPSESSNQAQSHEVASPAAVLNELILSEADNIQKVKKERYKLKYATTAAKPLLARDLQQQLSRERLRQTQSERRRANLYELKNRIYHRKIEREERLAVYLAANQEILNCQCEDPSVTAINKMKMLFLRHKIVEDCAFIQDVVVVDGMCNGDDIPRPHPGLVKGSRDPLMIGKKEKS